MSMTSTAQACDKDAWDQCKANHIFEESIAEIGKVSFTSTLHIRFGVSDGPGHALANFRRMTKGKKKFVPPEGLLRHQENA